MDKISNERKAQVFYQGDGTQTQYSFSFDYLRKAFVHVSLISYEKIEELTQGTDYTVTDRVVTLAAPTGLKIKIYRQTATKPLVGWADASVLRAADMTVQSTQLLHLAEETSDSAQDGGLSKDTTDNVWDARYNKIKNLLEPTEPGDAVNLSYITKSQTGLLTQLNNTGAAQNASIVSTGDTQNKRVTDTGNAYVSTMTTLRDATIAKATEANNSAALAKEWAVSDTSPDGATASKSAKTWAGEAKASASASASSADSSASYVATATSSANAAEQSALSSANSASSAATSASNASTSATNAQTSETKAAASAAAAAQSAEAAKTWDPTQYVQSVTASNGKVTVTKGGGASTIINLIDTFYPVGTVYMSADKNKTKANFPFMQYGTWTEVPANLCLQTGNASAAGTKKGAGLPNIKGQVTTGARKMDEFSDRSSGALRVSEYGANKSAYKDGANTRGYQIVTLDASRSSSIYGASSTVQPPAYIVRAWVRTA